MNCPNNLQTIKREVFDEMVGFRIHEILEDMTWHTYKSHRSSWGILARYRG